MTVTGIVGRSNNAMLLWPAAHQGYLRHRVYHSIAHAAAYFGGLKFGLALFFESLNALRGMGGSENILGKSQALQGNPIPQG